MLCLSEDSEESSAVASVKNSVFKITGTVPLADLFANPF